MNDLNSVSLIGRLVRDCEMVFTKNGTAVCKMTIASNRSEHKNDKWEDKPCFFDTVIFGKRGEGLSKYLTKGQRVGIKGELDFQSWQDDSGNKKSRVQIIADNIFLLGQSSSWSGQSSSPQNTQNNDYSTMVPDEDRFEDDVPF